MQESSYIINKNWDIVLAEEMKQEYFKKLVSFVKLFSLIVGTSLYTIGNIHFILNNWKTP